MKNPISFTKSIRARFLAISLLIEVIMLTLLVGNSVRLIQKQMQLQLENRIIAIELAYKTAVAAPLASRDYATLRDILDGWRGANDVTYLAVTDTKGTLVASSGLKPGEALPKAGQRKEARDIIFSVDYLGQSYGNVHYGLSTAAIESAIRTLFSQSILIALAEIILSLLLLSATCFMITRNLSALAAASAEVAGGDFSQRITVTGHDEVALLARNFNCMIASVQQDNERILQYQAELEQAKQRLETTISSAREMAQLAEQATVAKREFLQNMSHELRTPMNGVLGMAQLLGFTEMSKEQQSYLASLETSADNLLMMITEILDLAAVSTQKLHLVSEPLNMKQLVDDAVAQVSAAAAQKGIKLQIWIDQALAPDLRGDPLRLGQVLRHLLENAVKFTPQGKIVVTVSPDKTNNNPQYVKISVQDTGIGIAEDRLTTIFSAFTQLDGSLTRQFGGVGLGLSLVATFVELMGGMVKVTSSEGVGSTFTVSVPLSPIYPLDETEAQCLPTHAAAMQPAIFPYKL